MFNVSFSKISLEENISFEIFIYLFINSYSNRTKTQVFTLNLTLTQILTQTVILILQKENEKWVEEYSAFLFCFL